jgi:histidine triad (HIT) family protein
MLALMAPGVVTDCVICRIASRDEPALIVASTESVISFLPLRMQAKGHTVVAPRRHFDNLYDISVEALADLMSETKRLALAYEARIGATGVNVLHASGSDAQQSVSHFHVHLLPRWSQDGLDAWPILGPPRADRKAVWRRLVE